MHDAFMLQWLTRRETIVALAIVGGALSILAGVLSSRRAGAAVAAAWCNRAAYVFMAASVLLFIVAGFAGP